MSSIAKFPTSFRGCYAIEEDSNHGNRAVYEKNWCFMGGIGYT